MFKEGAIRLHSPAQNRAAEVIRPAGRAAAQAPTREADLLHPVQEVVAAPAVVAPLEVEDDKSLCILIHWFEICLSHWSNETGDFYTYPFIVDLKNQSSMLVS
jgi:hypothetical protein